VSVTLHSKLKHLMHWLMLQLTGYCLAHCFIAEALLLAGGDQGLIELQQVELGSAKDSSISISMLGTSVAHSAGITDITTCGGTNHAASCSSDGMIASWDIVAGVQPAGRFTSHQGPVNSIACSPSSSTTLASCGQDGGVSLWDLRSNQRSSSSSLDAPGCSICWVDDAAVVVGDALGRLQLIDTRQMQAASVVRQHQDVIMGLQYSKAAGQVLTASDDGSARTAAIKGGVLVPAASAVCAASSSFMRAAAWMSASEVLLSNWDGLLWCSQLQPAASP
jgi:WD40 repeat protein